MDRRIAVGAGVGVLALLLFRNRKAINMALQRVYTEAGRLAFRTTLSTAARPYADFLLEAAKRDGHSPFILAAIMQHESLSGEALRPKGPTGTGDFTARPRRSIGKGQKAVGEHTFSDGKKGYLVVPADGGGWGRGLMQVDFESNYEWLVANDMGRDPRKNILKGSEIFLGKIKALTQRTASGKYLCGGVRYDDPRPLVGDKLIKSAIAAYNTGEGNVICSLAKGRDVDTTTATGSYSADRWKEALAKARLFEQVFPATPPQRMAGFTGATGFTGAARVR